MLMSPTASVTAQTVTPEMFGALAAGLPDQGFDDSLAFQRAISFLSSIGGGTLKGTPGKSYPIRYPICIVGSNISLDLTGVTLLSDMGRSGRSAGPIIQYGNSREYNLTTINTLRTAGNLSSSFVNSSFTDITLGTFPSASGATYQASNCEGKDGHLFFYSDNLSAQTTCVYFSNCKDCHHYDFTGDYGGTGANFGSDVAPNNPYALNCSATGTVYHPNQTHTFYSAHFFGYAQSCYAKVKVNSGVANGTPDGNLAATSYAQDCVSNSSGVCGFGANGQGHLFGANSARCFHSGNISSAVTAFADSSPLAGTAANANSYANSIGISCTNLMSGTSKQTQWNNIRGINITSYEFLAGNVNATNYRFTACDMNRISVPDGWTVDTFLSLNQVESSSGLVTRVIRPWLYLDPLVNNSTYINSNAWNNQNYKTNAATTLTMRIPLSDFGFTSFTNISIFGTIGANGQTASTSVVVTIYQTGTTPIDGNTSATPTSLATATYTPPSNSSFDFHFNDSSLSGIASLGNSSYQSDIYIQIDVINPVLGTTIKMGTITGPSI